MLNITGHSNYNHSNHFQSEWNDCNVVMIYIEKIGYVRFVQFKEDLNKISIEEVFVEQTFRKTGFGTILLNYVVDICKENNVQIIDLKVKEDSWMKNWYKRLGFLEYETLTNEYKTLIKII